METYKEFLINSARHTIELKKKKRKERKPKNNIVKKLSQLMNSKNRMRLPWWLSGKESTCQCKRYGFNPWVRKTPLEKEMATCSSSSFLPGKSHGKDEPGGLPSIGLQRVGHDWVTKQQRTVYCIRKALPPVNTVYSPLLASASFKHLKYLHFITKDEGSLQESWDKWCCPLVISSTRAGRPAALMTTL